jgi:hypothetical protein
MQPFQLTAALLLWQTVSGQPITYCGPDPCLVPINGISCSDLILNYKFLGSCCRLVDIPATGGCRVEVGGPGGANCAWVPFCGSCDHSGDSFCGTEYRTDTDDACPDVSYDALTIQSSWRDSPTCAPSSVPSVAFSEAPSELPTLMPAVPTPSPTSLLAASPTTSPGLASPTSPPSQSSDTPTTLLFIVVVTVTLLATFV